LLKYLTNPRTANNKLQTVTNAKIKQLNTNITKVKLITLPHNIYGQKVTEPQMQKTKASINPSQSNGEHHPAM